MPTQPQSRRGSRAANRSLVLRQVLRAKRISRSQIAGATGLTMGAVSRITQELIDARLLAPVGAHAPAGKPGRRFVELAPAPNGGYVLGVDIEASVQHALIVDLAGQVLARQRLHFLRDGDPRASVERLARDLQRIIGRARIEPGRLFGVGVAAVGVVDPSEGTVIDSPIPGWHHVEVGQPLREALGLPVRVDSMLNALNLAEHRYGLTRGKRNVLLVHTTLGIGASFLADGAVVRGQGMQAGQIAHARVAGATLPCSCGRRGCLTTVASGHAILRSLEISQGRVARTNGDLERERRLLDQVLVRAEQNHESSVSAVLNAGRSLGRFLGTLVAFSSPEAILLGGRLGGHATYLWGVREGLREYQPSGRAPEVSPASMGGENAATLLAVEDLVCSQPIDLERFRPRPAARRAA
jgi:predicted NBD/HSP70 family sugar kinase